MKQSAKIINFLVICTFLLGTKGFCSPLALSHLEGIVAKDSSEIHSKSDTSSSIITHESHHDCNNPNHSDQDCQHCCCHNHMSITFNEKIDSKESLYNRDYSFYLKNLLIPSNPYIGIVTPPPRSFI